MDVVDGNALAGVLADALGPDAILVRLRCDGCGSTGPLATVRVHRSAMGSVARCPACGAVLVTVVETRRRPRVVLVGARPAAH